MVLAQALVCEPALVIADEPTASLDARSQDELLTLLRELQRELRISILLISHSAEVQARLADRLMVMAGGRIVEQGRFEVALSESIARMHKRDAARRVRLRTLLRNWILTMVT